MKRLITIFTLLICCLCTLCCAEDMKLYRNKDWKFRIEFPVDWEYRTPKSPNTVLVARNKQGYGVVITAYPEPEFNNPTREDWEKHIMPTINLDGINIMNVYFVPINSHTVLLIEGTKHYKYPTTQFVQYHNNAIIITNNKYYNILYGCNTQDAQKCVNIFLKSLGTFVDETNFY